VTFAAEPEYRVDLSVSSFKPDRIADLDFAAPADIRLSGVCRARASILRP
jgi:hypothetical protein